MDQKMKSRETTIDDDVTHPAPANGSGKSSRPRGGLAPHALESLSDDELRTVAGVVRDHLKLGNDLRFEIIELHEPPKQQVYRNGGAALPREARVNAYHASQNGVWRLIVSITERRVTSQQFIEDVYPRIQLEEFDLIQQAVLDDPRFIEACRKRGITDLSLVVVDPWSAGRFGIEDEEGRFVCHTFALLRHSPHENQYAHPIEGVHAVVDVRTIEVIRVDDHGVVPIPTEEHNWEHQFLDEFQPALKELDIVQPKGVEFRRSGGRLTWRDWSLVVGFNAREGLTLHDIRFDGRPVCYRASIAELVVPYGSSTIPHHRKNVFDAGEYGLGMFANSLTLGCDCLGAIDYMDGWVTDYLGNPKCIPNAICIHEEDTGILWKHTDFRTGHVENRRGRRLVVSSISTLTNYEYAFYWYLYLDGTIECEMKATGIVNTAACLPGQPGKYATEVAPGVIAQNHQHLFCTRLDMAVDGETNTVLECDSVPEKPELNPNGNAWYLNSTPIRQDSGRDYNVDAHRFWKIINPNKKNRSGYPVGYKIAPTNFTKMMACDDSPSGQRMNAFKKALWVTRFDPEERYPSGEYVHLSTGKDGLPAYVAKERSTDNADIVVWYNFGVHHLVRCEDWPVQSVVMSGFKLMPADFFDRNPVSDLPPSTNAASCHANTKT